MQETAAQPDTPERRSAQLLRSGRAAVLDDTVSCAHVVEQEVTVGMDDLVAERIWNDKRAAVNHRTRRSGNDGRNVASVAADAIEDCGAGLRVSCIFEVRIASG